MHIRILVEVLLLWKVEIYIGTNKCLFLPSLFNIFNNVNLYFIIEGEKQNMF